MQSHRSITLRRLVLALIAVGAVTSALLIADSADAVRTATVAGDAAATLPETICGPGGAGQPALLKTLVAATTKSETAPFQPQAMQAASGDVLLYRNLGALAFNVGTRVPQAQAYFNQGVRLAFAFNHAEAQRAFQAAQRLDPECAMCFWGEALVLGPNINAPMIPEANAPALAALAKATALKAKAGARDQALIDALAKRYSADPKIERAPLDAAYADAMKEVAIRFAADDTVQTLYAEAAMDTQPWDYWEAAGARPKGRGADIVGALETVLKRNPSHPGAIHLYIHAVEASTNPEKALPHAKRLAALMPGAGHVVHMPAHIYYRVGLYRDSLTANQRAIQVDEDYFRTSPSDPMYKAAYYPHNIHFVMVSAQMGGDAKTAIAAAEKLDAALANEAVQAFAVLQPVKASTYTTHAQFSDPDTILKLKAPGDDLVLVKTMYHYARAVAFASRKDAVGAQGEIDALGRIERDADFKPFEAWGLPAREIVQTAVSVARGRVADAAGDLEGAAKAYESAIAIADGLAYYEPPFWYYPVRQSLGSVRLRQGRLDDAEKAFRESLARVRNSGWALAGLVEVAKRRGDAKAEQTARASFERAWFGTKDGPDLSRL
jgi:tetratricopeptide (TPR) repeat protein